MTDEQLLTGDDAALGELFDRYREPLTKFVSDHRIQDADDLVQEVFIFVADNRYRFIEGKHFKPWLYTIAADLIREHRTAKRQAKAALASPEMESLAEVYQR